MKTSTLLLAVLLLSFTSVSANNNPEVQPYNNLNLSLTSSSSNNRAITFEENDIKFSIFLNGDFDFNTDSYKSTSTEKLSSDVSKYGTTKSKGVTFRYEGIGLIVKYDESGKITRVGNVYINYDNDGRIKKSGSVDLKYKNGKLKRIGDLQVIYDAKGKFIGTKGSVNSNNITSNVLQTNADNDEWIYNTNSHRFRKEEKENMKRRYDSF